jgi:hypothetical protein
MMRDRQWIRVQLPDIKSLSIPIKISKTSLSNHLAGYAKDLLEDLSDDESRTNESPAKKKRKTYSVDIVDIFTINPDPIKNYSLDTNSSTLAVSNTHILIHDNHQLILFDYHKKLSELQWSDNDYGLFFLLIKITEPFFYFFSRYSCGYVLDGIIICICNINNTFCIFI